MRKKVQGYNRSDLKRGRLKYYVRFEKFMEDELTLNQVALLIQNSFARHGKMVCYLCSREVFLDYTKKNQEDQFTLDRIDNKKSHRIDNVQICCLTCNILRSDQYEPEEFTWKFKLRGNPQVEPQGVNGLRGTESPSGAAGVNGITRGSV